MSEYIKREDAIALAWYATYEDEWHMHKLEKVVSVEDIVGLPAADVVERKKGKWVAMPREDYQTFDECVCSECNTVEYFNVGWKWFNFCPNCGADMRGEA